MAHSKRKEIKMNGLVNGWKELVGFFEINKDIFYSTFCLPVSKKLKIHLSWDFILIQKGFPGNHYKKILLKIYSENFTTLFLMSQWVLYLLYIGEGWQDLGDR